MADRLPQRSTRIGTVARRAAGYGVLALVALVALKLVVGAIVQAVVSLAVVVALALAVVWALRRV